MNGGYWGKFLRINLTDKSAKTETFDENFAKQFLGGRGFGAALLFGELKPGTDPLGPENKLIIATGPLSGLFFPGTGKTSFVFKSPATGGYGDSSMGGHFGPELKSTGCDALIVEGKSKKPCMIVVDDDKAEIRDAKKYWGKGSLKAERQIKKDLGGEFIVAAIGPGGENLVRFACLTADMGRNAGRCGIGAVLGKKKVKAIAVRGTKDLPVADFRKFSELGMKAYDELNHHKNLKWWQDSGTMTTTPWAQQAGCIATGNFSEGTFDKAEGISEAAMRKIVRVDRSCFSCPMACGKWSVTRYKSAIEGPEYETNALLGSNCRIGDIEAVVHANYLCDELGLDTISAGNVIGFAMECVEKGIINKKQTGGINLRFGNEKAVFKLIKLIAERKGIGKVLAEGVRHASRVWGKGSEKFAMHVKGLEWSGYESRGAPGMTLSYGTADVGAHHNRAWVIAYEIKQGDKRFSTENKAEKVIELQHIRPLFDQLGACRLQWVELGFGLEHYPEIINAITGWNCTWDDLMRSAERVYNLTRAFNVREGFGRKDDMVPARVLEEPMPSGPAKGHFVDINTYNALLDRFYELRGWDRNGVPTESKLKELGLDWVAQELARAGKLK